MRKLLIVLALIASVAVPLVWLGRSGATREGGPGALDVARVSRRDVGSVVKATGIVRPVDGADVRVGSRASGVVERLRVRLGDRVEKGEPLAELDTRELEARRDQAAAALASARASRADAQAARAARNHHVEVAGPAPPSG